MKLQDVESILMIIMYSFFVGFFVIIFFLLVYGFAKSKRSEKKYKIAIIKIILTDDWTAESYIKETIRNTYDNYRTKSSFSYLGFYEINARLVAELRDDSYLRYSICNDEITAADIRKFEKINKEIKADFQFTDEKTQKVLSIVGESALEPQVNDKLCEEIKLFFEATISYCNGRIFEKEQEISRKNFEITKLTKKRWYNRIGWLVGIISSVITISSVFK